MTKKSKFTSIKRTGRCLTLVGQISARTCQPKLHLPSSTPPPLHLHTQLIHCTHWWSFFLRTWPSWEGAPAQGRRGLGHGHGEQQGACATLTAGPWSPRGPVPVRRSFGWVDYRRRRRVKAPWCCVMSVVMGPQCVLSLELLRRTVVFSGALPLPLPWPWPCLPSPVSLLFPVVQGSFPTIPTTEAYQYQNQLMLLVSAGKKQRVRYELQQNIPCMPKGKNRRMEKRGWGGIFIWWTAWEWPESGRSPDSQKEMSGIGIMEMGGFLGEMLAIQRGFCQRCPIWSSYIQKSNLVSS